MSGSSVSASVQYQPPQPWQPAPDIPRRPARSELMARLCRSGPGELTDAEVLSLVTGASIGVVARLLEEFGSLPEVLAATPAALRRRASRTAAARLGLAADLGRRMLQAPLRRRPVLSSWSAVLAYLRAVLAGVAREQFRVLFLDKKNQLIADEVLGFGTVDHAPVYPREVVRRALELNASALVLAHNHPSGDPTPSSADVDMTRRVVEAARALGIAVHDHIVIGGQDAASLKALGLM